MLFLAYMYSLFFTMMIRGRSDPITGDNYSMFVGKVEYFRTEAADTVVPVAGNTVGPTGDYTVVGSRPRRQSSWVCEIHIWVEVETAGHRSLDERGNPKKQPV